MPGASDGPSAGEVDGPASPEGVSFAFPLAGAAGSSPLQPTAPRPLMMMGALPLTPGGGIESPAARLLLSAMRPGWTLDPGAHVSTPYVEQLLRTLPVLTPDTGLLSGLYPNRALPILLRGSVHRSKVRCSVGRKGGKEGCVQQGWFHWKPRRAVLLSLCCRQTSRKSR